MAKTISFFIIGIFILESKICWGLDDSTKPEWWESALIYEITFANTGEIQFHNFRDIIEHLDYLKYMGMDAICLPPIFPMDQGGIDNFMAVNMSYGSMRDYNQLIEKAHDIGIKVILEVKPYFTSSKHAWFLEWTKNTPAYNNFYIPANEQPRQLIYYAWSEKKRTWYSRRYPNKPDLQLADSSVRNAVNEDIFRFWLSRGVNGFRITGLSEYNPLDENAPESQRTIEKNNKEYLHDIRTFVDQWTASSDFESKYLIVETLSNKVQTWADYYGTAGSPGVTPQNLVLTGLRRTSKECRNATKLKGLIKSQLDEVPSNASTNWILSVREGRSLIDRMGLQRARAFTILSMLLPGQAFTLTSDEVNLDDDWNNYSKPDLFSIDEGRNRIFRQLAFLRKSPIFARKKRSFGALNDDAVFVSRSELPGNSTVYLVVLNLRESQEHVNLTDLYRDLEDSVRILLTTDTNKSLRTLNVTGRDSIIMSGNAGTVLVARLKERETWTGEGAGRKKSYDGNVKAEGQGGGNKTSTSGKDEPSEKDNDDKSVKTVDEKTSDHEKDGSDKKDNDDKSVIAEGQGGGNKTSTSGKDEPSEKDNDDKSVKTEDGKTSEHEKDGSDKKDNDDKSVIAEGQGGGNKTSTRGKDEPSEKDNDDKSVRTEDGKTSEHGKDGSDKKDNDDKSAIAEGEEGGNKTSKNGKDEPSEKDNDDKRVKIGGEGGIGKTNEQGKDGSSKKDNDDKSLKTGGEEGDNKTGKSGKDEPSVKDNDDKRIKIGGGEGGIGKTSKHGKDESSKKDNDDKSLKTGGEEGGNKTSKSGKAEPSEKDNNDKRVKIGGGRTGENEKDGSGKKDNDDKRVKIGGGRTGENEKDGSAKKDNDDKRVEIGGEEGSEKTSENGKDGSRKKDNDDKSLKTGGGKTGKSGKDGSGKKDNEDKSVGIGGKKPDKSGDDVAGRGNEDREVNERVDDSKGNSKQVNKDVGSKGEEEKSKWGKRKNVGLFGRIMSQLYKTYLSKMQKSVSLLKTYRRNLQ